MSTPLLARLHELGVVLTIEGSAVKWKAPPGVVTLDVLAAIKAEKPYLLALSRAAKLPGPPRLCRWCQGRDFWQARGGRWTCERCHPAEPAAVLAAVRAIVAIPRFAPGRTQPVGTPHRNRDTL